MQKICKQVLTILSLIIFFVFGIPGTKAHAQYEDTYVSYNDFYQNLAPYGQWIEDPQYGYVWSPNEDGSFRPYYTAGHWVMTDYGNTWISDYPWGWACFHYGRWTYDTYYGWLWIPGNDWGPAWVSWREGDGYFGWAPLAPGFSFGSSAADYSCPNDWWVFIPHQYIYTSNYYRIWYGSRGNSRIIHNTHFMNNTFENNHVTYVSGPHAMQVEQVTHQPVQVFKLSNSASLTTRVHNDVIKMYRPAEIRPSTTINGQRVLPPNVVTAPQPVNKPQPTNGRINAAPEFRNDLPNNPVDAVGTHVNEPEKATPKPRNVPNPYEYDVNRPVIQPQPGEGVPQRNQPEIQTRPQPQNTRPLPPAPAPQRQSPAPAPQRQNPAPAPQRQNPAPAPLRQNPAPAPATRPANAPAQQQRESGKR